MTLWFIISLILKRNDVADFAWGIGFFIVSLVSFDLAGLSARGLIVELLVYLGLEIINSCLCSQSS
jgi:steroid 5-alpha reductase family enzyme